MIAATRQGPIADVARARVRELFPEVAEIADRELAHTVVEIWAEA